MRITTVIPTFNNAKPLKRALDSVLGQSVQPGEILVLDDCSTDNTKKLVQKYHSRWPHIMRYWCYQKKAQDWLKNHFCFAQAMATGDFIHSMGADDCVLPGFYETATRLLALYPRVNCVFGDSVVADATGKVLYQYNFPVADNEHFSPGKRLDDYLSQQSGLVGGAATLVRRGAWDFLVKHHIWKMGWCSDCISYACLAVMGGCIILQRPYGVVTQKDDNYSKRTRADHERRQECVAQVQKFLSLPEIALTVPPRVRQSLLRKVAEMG